MVVMTGSLVGLAAYPTAALVWASGPVAALILAAGLLLSVSALALEVEGGSRSAHGSSPRGGQFVPCAASVRAAA